MPYIKDVDRDFDSLRAAKNAGELNYIITRCIVDYWDIHHSKGYQAINDIVGALEGAKLEFNRRVVTRYEDRKIAENGDVY